MRRTRRALVIAASCAMLGCAAGGEARRASEAIEAYTGSATNWERMPDDPPALPSGVAVVDGLSADEAAAIALWNSAALRVDLTRLHRAEADVLASRRVANPTLRALLPIGPQQFSLLLIWPVEAFATMPRRAKIARTTAEAVAESVVQTALDLTRDAKLAHAEWLLAFERLTIQTQLAAQTSDVAKIAEARAAVGDVPLREADAARGDADVAADAAQRGRHDVAIARTRLTVLLGWPVPSGATPVAPDPLLAATLPDDLQSLALRSRPDLRSAELSIEAAGARIGLEKWAALGVAGVGSVQAGGGAPASGAIGPQLVLPIFDQNQAGIARADADLQAATWRYHDLKLRIVAEVAETRVRLEQATGSLSVYRDTIVAARERERNAASAEYELGEQDYVVVSLAQQRIETARLREVELAADARRARVALERALGRRLDGQEGPP